MSYAYCKAHCYDVQETDDGGLSHDYSGDANFFSSVFPLFLPTISKTTVDIPSFEQIREEILPDKNRYWNWALYQGATEQLTVNDNGTNNLVTVSNFTIPAKDGVYTAIYTFEYYSSAFGVTKERKLTLSYVFNLTENRLPLKKWTVTDMINRIFDTVVPLFDRQKPKFRLKGVIYDDETGNPVGVIPGSTADRLNKILAPEMTFTKMTLREMLKQVGGFIHGEPRITAINYEKGKRWYEIDFDFYGGFSSSIKIFASKSFN